MVFNATFNNISVILWQSAILWQSVLLVEETGVPRENHRPVTSHWQTLSHNVSSTTHHEWDSTTTLVVIGTDCIGSCKSNYHTIYESCIFEEFQFQLRSSLSWNINSLIKYVNWEIWCHFVRLIFFYNLPYLISYACFIFTSLNYLVPFYSP